MLFGRAEACWVKCRLKQWDEDSSHGAEWLIFLKPFSDHHQKHRRSQDIWKSKEHFGLLIPNIFSKIIPFVDDKEEDKILFLVRLAIH